MYTYYVKYTYVVRVEERGGKAMEKNPARNSDIKRGKIMIKMRIMMRKETQIGPKTKCCHANF
jgi:hypothetical protein